MLFHSEFRTLLGTKGIATRSKDATRGSWFAFSEWERLRPTWPMYLKFVEIICDVDRKKVSLLSLVFFAEPGTVFEKVLSHTMLKPL